MKPATPILRNEHYLDVMTGGSASLPSPILREERYLAKLAGMDVSIPNPVTIKEKYYAKICGMDVDVPTYTRNMPRIYAYMAKAAGQTIEELPTAVTREQRYWYDYVSEQPVTEHEYTGAVPYTFNANGEPLLDFLISGNMVQNGTPSPTAPIQPSETGERTNNLSILNGVTDIITNKYYKNNRLTDNPLTAGTYTLSFSMDDKTAGLLNGTIGYGTESSYTYDVASYQTPDKQMPYRITVTFTLTQQNIDTYGGYIWIRFVRSPVQTDFRYTVSEIMLNTGSSPLLYEPFGVKIPISSANTTTPIYLGEVETERKIRKLVFDGTEDWVDAGNSGHSWRITQSGIRRSASQSVVCDGYMTHYQAQQFYTIYNGRDTGFGIPATADWISVCDLSISSLEDFKTYLAQQYAAGTPVCVWYVLETPQTAVVNEPLRKIGTYADTLSMEQAGVNIPTNNGSTTIDVETTLKPSEIYIKWKGV